MVSRTLRQLEDHLGVRLIDRSTHHLGLTAAGHAFQIRAASAVAAANAAFDPAQLGSFTVPATNRRIEKKDVLVMDPVRAAKVVGQFGRAPGS